MWLHLLLCTTEMCHLAVRRYTHSSTAALTMKLFMILGALLLPATVEAKTYRPIQPLWGGQCAIPGVSDGSSSYCCTHSLPTLLTQQDCENKCNADANCVAYSWKISYNHCQVYDATGLPDLDAVVGSRSLSPPQGHSDANCYVVVLPPPPPSPPPSILSCAALDDPTTCTEKDSKKVHRRCSPSAKPGWGGVGHKKCAKLCEKTDERLSAKCKQACCVTPPSSPSPSPPPPNPVATCPAGTFNNGEGTPTSPVCESCDQLLPPCDSCATLTHTRTRKPIHQPPHV